MKICPCSPHRDEPFLRNCCCCNVSSGALAVAILWIIFSSIQLLMALGTFIMFFTFTYSSSQSKYDYEYNSFDGSTKIIHYNSSYYTMVVVAVSQFFVLLLMANQLAASVALVVGINRRNIQLMLWFIISAFIRTVLNGTLLIISFCFVYAYWPELDNFAAASILILGVFGIGGTILYFDIHSLLCVVSHRRNEVRELGLLYPQGGFNIEEMLISPNSRQLE